MIHKQMSPLPGHVRVVFELPSCIWADRIFVTGEFNDWSETNLPMRQDRDGVWRVMLDLPLGHRYEFRYIIDGRWQSDYHADGCASNGYGSENSIVVAEFPQTPVEVDVPGSLVREQRFRPVKMLRRSPASTAAPLPQRYTQPVGVHAA